MNRAGADILGGTGVELLAPIAKALWVASIAAQVILVCRIAQERLLRRYFFFAAYLTAETLFSLLLMQIDFRTHAYAESFGAYTWVILILRIAVGCELWERICEHFPGVGKFRFSLAAALAVIGALIALAYEPHLQWSFPQTVALVIKRFESQITAVVFIGVWLFFRHVIQSRAAWRSNVLNHWRITTVYFAIGGITSLAVLVSGGGKWVYAINCVMLIGDLGCLFAWTWCFRRAGERLAPKPYMSEIEIQEIREREFELLTTVSQLPAEISRRLADSRAGRSSTRRLP